MEGKNERQDEQVERFARAFLDHLFELGKKEDLPENLKFKGVNCVRNFAWGDSISFNIVFNKAK